MILKPQPNQPLTLSLANPNPEEVKGQYGIQFKYRLENRDLIYLPPIAHEEIQKLHAGPGEPFTLTKTIGQGNQAVWKVERILQEGDPETTKKSGHPGLQKNDNFASKSITNGNGVKPVAVMPATAPTLATPQSRAMVRQLFAAIDAIKLARDYASQIGVPFEPTSRDICALAITGGIQVFKEGVY